MKAITLVALAGAAVLAAAGAASGEQGVWSIVTRHTFHSMLSHRGDGGCEGGAFYTYGAFIEAASKFGGFGTTGDEETCKRELAAFFGQNSHETGGYCFVKEQSPTGDRYYGRGPIQLTKKEEGHFSPCRVAIRDLTH